MFFFLLFGQGPRPRPNSKKKHAPAQTAKKKRPHPFRACCFFAVWAGGCVYFFAVWAGGRVLFCCLGGGRVLFFAVWAGACFFLLFGRGRVLFFAVWAGGVFFFAVWAGDGSSLTYPSAWLVFKRPNNKRDRTAKKNTGSTQNCNPKQHNARKFADFMYSPSSLHKTSIQSLHHS